MTAASPKPRSRSHGKQWGKSDSERAKKPSRREGEPRTLEGRARRKMQFGQLYRSGCVFTYAEMMEVIKVLPDGWMELPCA